MLETDRARRPRALRAWLSTGRREGRRYWPPMLFRGLWAPTWSACWDHVDSVGKPRWKLNAAAPATGSPRSSQRSSRCPGCVCVSEAAPSISPGSTGQPLPWGSDSRAHARLRGPCRSRGWLGPSSHKKLCRVGSGTHGNHQSSEKRGPCKASPTPGQHLLSTRKHRSWAEHDVS